MQSSTAARQMDKREHEAKQSNMGSGESAGGGFANPGEHGLGGGYTGKMSDITGGKTGGFKDLTGRVVCEGHKSRSDEEIELTLS